MDIVDYYKSNFDKNNVLKDLVVESFEDYSKKLDERIKLSEHTILILNTNYLTIEHTSWVMDMGEDFCKVKFIKEKNLEIYYHCVMITWFLHNHLNPIGDEKHLYPLIKIMAGFDKLFYEEFDDLMAIEELQDIFETNYKNIDDYKYSKYECFNPEVIINKIKELIEKIEEKIKINGSSIGDEEDSDKEDSEKRKFKIIVNPNKYSKYECFNPEVIINKIKELIEKIEEKIKINGSSIGDKEDSDKEDNEKRNFKIIVNPNKYDFYSKS